MTRKKAKQKSWTTRNLLRWTTDYFTQKEIDSPRLSAEMLLSHALGVDRLKLYMDPDRPASEIERTAFRGLVERAINHEPVNYLVGWAPFFSLKLKVNPSVLIPRPSSETIVEHVIQHCKQTPDFTSPVIADIATGSGAIAIALAKNIAKARIIATDISDAALEVAKENGIKYKVDNRIDFFAHDMTKGFEDIMAPVNKELDFFISNPPYISDSEWEDVEKNVKAYEPESALRGGEDGLDFVRLIIKHAPDYLSKNGQLVLEIAAGQKQSVLEMAENSGLASVHVLNDHENLPRVLVATKNK